MKKVNTLIFLIGFFGGALKTNAQVTFNNDIAPIIFAKCANCHNPNGINNQLPFTNYNEVVSDTGGIHNDLLTNHMPPWPPDTTYTKFLHQNERALTAIEKNKILQWISNGSPQGTGTAPACPSYVVSNRLAGKADLVIGLGNVRSNSNSTTTNPYDCFVVPTGLTEDRWLRAVEIVPGNLKAIHHVVVTVDTTGTAQSDFSGSCNNQPGQFGIGGWSSQAAPVVYPNKAPLKAGQRIPKGSSIVMQIHFAPGSGGMIDSTKIRLYFYNKDSIAGIRPVRDDVVLQYWGINIGGASSNPSNIAANTAGWFTVNPGSFGPSASSAIGYAALPDPQVNNTDMSILATNPHSHLVCTKVMNYAFNGTDTIPLIRIKDWNYHWQGYYYHPKPVKVPYTHKLESKHFYDNTTNNKELPSDPANSVSFGTKTENEMLFDDFVWMKYQPGDENINIDSLLKGDPIFNNGLSPKPYEKAITVANELTVIELVENNINQISVNPNPADNKLNISIGQVSVHFIAKAYTAQGQMILQTENFNSDTTIDISSLTNGLYFLEITNSLSGEKITKKIIITH